MIFSPSFTVTVTTATAMDIIDSWMLRTQIETLEPLRTCLARGVREEEPKGRGEQEANAIANAEDAECAQYYGREEGGAGV